MRDAASPFAGPLGEERGEPRLLSGKYRLGERIGSGSMGVVYAAEHATLKRPCAIKLLHRTLVDDPILLQRFRQEAARAGRLLHEHIVAVTDYDVCGGTPYLVMERLHGQTLAELCEAEPPLSLERAALFGAQIARGLGAAHAHGIVHRDLKPQNVFVTRRADGSELIKVLDFGVAKGLGDESSSAARGAGVIGTLRYMAPEQLRDPTSVDGRSDVYALGLLLFEMVAGRPAFDAPDAPSVIQQALSEGPPSLRWLRPDLPEAFVAVIERAIRRDRSERFASASELGHVLSRWTGASSASPPTDAATSDARTHRRARVLLWTAALGLLVVCAMAALRFAAAPSLPAESRVVPRVVLHDVVHSKPQPQRAAAQGAPLEFDTDSPYDAPIERPNR